MRGASQRHAAGVSGMFASSMLFGLMAFFVRLASADVPLFVIVFVRALGGLLILAAFFALRLASFRPRNFRLLFLRGFFGAIALMLWFHSISTLSLSKAVFYFNTYPLYAALFSALFLGERMTLPKAGGVACVLGGLVFLSGLWRFDFHASDWPGIASGVFSGAAMAVLHQVRKTDDSWTIVAVFLLSALAASLPLAAAGMTAFHGRVWLLLALIVAASTAGQVIMTYAYRYCTATEGSVISSTSVVFPAALGYAFLGEQMSAGTLAGGALIVAGGIIASLAEQAPAEEKISAL